MKRSRAGKPKPRPTKPAGGLTTIRRNRTPLAVKEEFVELRAQGLPLKKVSEKLGVSTKTLVIWGKELRDEIANHRAVELEVIREKFYLTTEKRIELFGDVVERIKKELARRDFKDVPTATLVKALVDTYETLRAEDVEPVMKTPDEIEQDRHAELLLLRLTAGTSTPRPERAPLMLEDKRGEL